MRNPTNFMDDMKKSRSRVSQKGRDSYEQKILRKLARVYGYKVSDIYGVYNDDQVKDPLYELRYKVDNPEFDLIFMSKIRDQTVYRFFYTLPKTEAWKKFCALADEHELRSLGMVFPVKENGDWIIHNLGGDQVKGTGRIVINSNDSSWCDVWLEPLEFFLKVREF